jgi:hypothetical protein
VGLLHRVEGGEIGHFGDGIGGIDLNDFVVANGGCCCIVYLLSGGPGVIFSP